MTNQSRTILMWAMALACFSSMASGVVTDAGLAEAIKGIRGLRIEPKEELAPLI